MPPIAGGKQYSAQQQNLHLQQVLYTLFFVKYFGFHVYFWVLFLLVCLCGLCNKVLRVLSLTMVCYRLKLVSRFLVLLCVNVGVSLQLCSPIWFFKDLSSSSPISILCGKNEEKLNKRFKEFAIHMTFPS